MKVFYIEYIISPYDGSIPVGVTSSLEAAVAKLEKIYLSGEETFGDIKDGTGHLITEFTLDDFELSNTLQYDGKGVLLNF